MTYLLHRHGRGQHTTAGCDGCKGARAVCVVHGQVYKVAYDRVCVCVCVCVSQDQKKRVDSMDAFIRDISESFHVTQKDLRFIKTAWEQVRTHTHTQTPTRTHASTHTHTGVACRTVC